MSATLPTFMPKALPPRCRVIIDNDFSGDPDDLYQLVHHLLSPSVSIPFIIGSHLSPNDPHDLSSQQADNAAAIAQDVLDLMGLASTIPVYAGSNVALGDPLTPIDNLAAQAIITEAMRTDTELPLYLALGAGMTELASALLIEPRIADRLTAIWIGGAEYPDLAEPLPKGDPVEYNLAIDVAAARTVFNDSTVPIWQVPRNVYRQCLVSITEIDARIRPMGAIGEYLAGHLDRVAQLALEQGHNFGETYALGDSPLVLLTALTAAYQPTPSSSFHVTRQTPRLTVDGLYEDNPHGRPIRIYTQVDTRLMFEDLYLKLAAHAARQRRVDHSTTQQSRANLTTMGQSDDRFHQHA